MRNRIAIVDIATRKFKALSYKQYDENNLLQMVILENGKIVDISSYNVIIYFKMPSGKIYREFGNIKNNTIDIILSSNVLYESGKVTLEVELRETDKIVTTFSIYLNIEKSIDDNDATDIEDTTAENIRHCHYNKDVLDIITQEMIDEWNNRITNLSDLVNDVGFVNEKYVIDKIEETKLDEDIKLKDYVKKTQMNEEIKKLTDADTSITEQMNEKFNELKSEDENIIAQIDIKNNNLNTQINEKIEQLKLDDKNILIQSKEYTDNAIANVKISDEQLANYATKDEIPTKTSQLENDSNFATVSFVTDKIEEAQLQQDEIDSNKYQTKEDTTLETTNKTIVGAINEVNTNVMIKANKSEIPTKTSQLTNDSNFLTSIPSEYVTESELNAKGYLTEHQDISNKADKSEIPTKTSQLQNDSDFATNASVDEKIANADTGETVDLTSYAKKTDLPTKTSQLINDSGYLTEHQDISGKADKSEIPTKTSQLQNDSNFISSIPSEYVTETELNAKGYLTEHQDISNKANKSDIPTKTSQLTNDSGFIVDIPSEYITESELNTELSTKANITDIPSLDGYATETYVQNKIAEAQVGGGEVDLSGYATKDELKTKANVNHTHTMSNITDLIVPDVDKAYVDTQLNTKANKSDIPNLEGYALKTDIPTVPTNVSQLTNDVGYITSIPSEYITEEELESKGYLTSIPNEYVTETELESKGYLTEHQDISGKANKSDIPTKTSQLNNDSGYLTSIPSEYVTETELESKGYLTEVPSEYITEEELNAKGYLTEHQDISGKVDKVEGKSLISNTEIERLANINNYDDTELRNSINNLNNNIDKIKKLEESTVSTIETESDFTTFEQTINGYFEDIKLEGKTLVVNANNEVVEPGTEGATLKSVGDGVDEIVIESVNGDGNLFDYTFTTNMAISGYGALYTNNSYSVSDYVRVRPNCTYIRYGNDDMCPFDKNKNALNQMITTDQGVFTTNSNTHFVRFNVRNEQVSYFRFNKGVELLDTPHQSDKKSLLYFNNETRTWEKPILRQFDTIEKHDNGKYYYHQRSGEVALNGSEGWVRRNMANENNTIGFGLHLGMPDSIDNPWESMICDILIPSDKDFIWNFDNESIGFSDYLHIRISKSKLSTQDVAGFKQWLQSNNVTVVYQLEQEKVYECTNIDLITYANETNYMANCGAIAPKSTIKVHNNISNVVRVLQKKTSLLENNDKPIVGEHNTGCIKAEDYEDNSITIDNNLTSRVSALETNKADKSSIPTSLPANGGNSDTVSGISIWVGTQSEYDAISTKSSTTLYFIREV